MSIRLKLTQHFQTRMLERGIEIDHVRQAIVSPDAEEAVFEGRTKVRKRISETVEIEVIYSLLGSIPRKLASGIC